MIDSFNHSNKISDSLSGTQTSVVASKYDFRDEIRGVCELNTFITVVQLVGSAGRPLPPNHFFSFVSCFSFFFGFHINVLYNLLNYMFFFFFFEIRFVFY